MKNKTITLSIFFMSIFSLLRLSGQDCVGFSFVESFDGGDLLVDIQVDNFEDIMGFQFAISYPSDLIVLTDLSGNTELGFTSANANTQLPGYLAVSWANPMMSETLPDESSLIQMRFNILDSGALNFQFVDLLDFEIFNGNFDLLCQDLRDNILNINAPRIVGTILSDGDEDCMPSAGDFGLAGWLVRIESISDTYFAITNASGNYIKDVPLGSYQVSVVPPNDLWISCTVDLTVNATAVDQVYEASIVMDGVVSSPALRVSIGAPKSEICEDNTYYITYKNEGVAAATNTLVTIELNEHMTYISSDLGSFLVDGTTVTAILGEVPAGGSGLFRIVANLDCDEAMIGEAVCISARASADETDPLPIGWTDAALETTVTCVGDSIEVVIENIGLNNVTLPLGFIVIEDDVMFNDNTTDPSVGERLVYRFADRGGLYRVIAQQPDGYPYGSFATSFVQSCEGDRSDAFDFASMFPEADDAADVDILCSEVVGPIPVNEIIAYPKGYRADNEISDNQDLEYTVRFQNTSGDTVNHISIQNYIDADLDLGSIDIGSASHNYTVRIDDGGVLRFDLYNVGLPDSEIDRSSSYGYVTYRIAQLPDLPIGTIIDNAADVAYDYGDAAATEVYTHIIAEDYIEIILGEEEVLLDANLTVAPNPVADMLRIAVPEGYSDISYVLYDLSGKVINAANCRSNAFYINRGMMIDGVYVLEIRSGERTLGTKKVIFQ